MIATQAIIDATKRNVAKAHDVFVWFTVLLGIRVDTGNELGREVVAGHFYMDIVNAIVKL